MRRSSGNSPEACKPTKRKRWRKDYAVCFLSTFCVFTITYASFHTAYFLPTHFYISLSDQQMTTSELFLPVLPDNLRNKSCSVLSGMTSGTWKTRPLTSKERHEISTFLKDSRDLISTNGDYQRPDLKCGNLTYTGSDYMKWFRVLCNPEGPTPCCFHNRCENRTVEECKGPLNYDLRPRVHAEYSTWVPHDKRCSVKLFVSQSACKLLEGATIYVIGDSLMRQLYTALIMILRGNFKTGALKANTPPAMMRKCSGMYMFPHKACRAYLDFRPAVCNGSFRLEFKHYPSASSRRSLVSDVTQLKGRNRSMVFLGIGLWDHYSYLAVVSGYLGPVVQALVARDNAPYTGWPRVLWSAPHRLGIWRYPYVRTVSNEYGKEFNANVAAYLHNFRIPVFDTFSVTDGVMSIDGTHYGFGVNVLKAQLFLNYIQQLEDWGMW